MFYTLLLFCQCQQAFCFLVPSHSLTKPTGRFSLALDHPTKSPIKANKLVCPGLALPYGLAKAKGYAQAIYEIPLECLTLNAMGLRKLERQFLEGCHP